MKKFTGIMVLLVVLASATAVAQERSEETVTTTDSTGATTTVKIVRVSETEDISITKNLVVINPLKFFLLYNIGYVRAVTPSIAIGGSIQTPTPAGISGFGFNLEARFYPSARYLRGFYVMPNISQNWFTSEGSDETITAFSVGGMVGWQWFPGDEFGIGLGLGIDRYFLGSNSEDESSDLYSFEGTVPALRFDIGYAW